VVLFINRCPINHQNPKNDTTSNVLLRVEYPHCSTEREKSATIYYPFVKYSNMEFKTWLDALIYPKETFKAEKERASLGDALDNIAVAGLIVGIVFGLISGLLLGLFGFVIGIIAFLIIVIILFLFESLVFFIMAKILGGKGDFSTHTYLISLITSPLVVLSLVGLIPIMGWILYILIALDSLYPLTISLRESHGFSTARAILTWLIPSIVLILILWQLGIFSPIGHTGHMATATGFEKIIVLQPSIKYSGNTLEFVMINAEGTRIENIKITLSGSGCRNPGEISTLAPGEGKRIKVICERKSPGEAFTVNVDIEYDLRVGRTKVNRMEHGILRGTAE